MKKRIISVYCILLKKLSKGKRPLIRICYLSWKTTCCYHLLISMVIVNYLVAFQAMQTNLLPLTIPDCRPVITSSINFCGVSKALETKYTVLRQKLLVDCLRIRMGTDQWEAMSQNDKQQKVMILDNQAVEQIQKGKIMPSLLGEGLHLQETVTQMMGLCKNVLRNKVKGQQVIRSTKTKENLDQLLLTFCID
ncbi:uncharacterized protein LOC127845904 [Dreissena polymorpha]|uniref:uncharacterized protein LOC127845904 n=1 Tax=Dreissena polymorpha TaxID=45954 RepID=UPI00226564B0|nr:uncharacterized protein LOC127845904 [Dreissena polymorpha]